MKKFQGNIMSCGQFQRILIERIILPVALLILLFESSVILGEALTSPSSGQQDPDTVHDIAWSPDGSKIAVATGPRRCAVDFPELFPVRILDAETGQILSTLEGHDCYVLSVAWSPDGSKIATSSDDGDGRVWDVTTGQTISVTDGEAFTRVLAAWSYDSSKIAGGFLNSNLIHVWDAMTGAALYLISDHTDFVSSLDWNPVSDKLASGSSDSTVRIWDGTTGQSLMVLTGHSFAVYSIAWSPDGARIASGGEDDTIQVWDASTGQVLQTLQGHIGDIVSITWSPDGSQIASGSLDGTIRFWNVATGQTLDVIQSNVGEIIKVAWSPVGNQLAYIGLNSMSQGGVPELISGPTLISCNITIPASDTTALISAITTANNTATPQTLCLTNSTYTLNAVDNTTDGANGLPSITGDITIVGNGATIIFETSGGFEVAEEGRLTLLHLTVISDNGG